VVVTSIPLWVTQLQAQLVNQTGVEVTVSQTHLEHWVLRLSNHRVQLESRHEGPDGKGAGATVTVDGTEYPFKYGPDEFMDIWNHPEMAHGALIPVPSPYGAGPVPANIQHMIGILRAKVDAPVATGFDGKRWIVGIGADDDTTGIRIFFIKHAKKWVMTHRRPIQLVFDGQDLSDECGNDLSAAMWLLTVGSGDTGEPGGSPVNQASARGNNGVQVRRANVIRV